MTPYVLYVCMIPGILCITGTLEYPSEAACTAAKVDMIRTTRAEKPEFLAYVETALCLPLDKTPRTK